MENTRTQRVAAAMAALAMILGPGFAVARSRDAEAAAERAVATYLAGRYEEALPDLEKANELGAGTGPLLYMTAFCYDAVRHDAELSSKTWTAAQEKLEKEIAEPKPKLESYFYLSNLYWNRKELDRQKTVAEAGVAAIESKKVKVGKEGTSQFRAGKLHSDAGKADPALDYYRRAVAAFLKEKNPPPEYLKRSLDPVARADLIAGKPSEVADMWEKLVALNPDLPDGDWSMGLAALRAGRFETARKAFERIQKSGGEQSQEALYAAKLAAAGPEVVSAGSSIPMEDAAGKRLSALDADALHEGLKEKAQKATSLLNREVARDEYVTIVDAGFKRIAPGPKLAKEIGDLHCEFVAIAVALLVRENALQARAFEGGYAPLIIHEDWRGLWWSAHQSLQEELDKSQPPAAPESGGL